MPLSEAAEEALHSRLHLVIPRGEARLRCQISAAHDTDQLDQAVEAFASVGKELGLI